MNQNHASGISGLLLTIAGIAAAVLPVHAVVILAVGNALAGIAHAVKPLLPPKAQEAIGD